MMDFFDSPLFWIVVIWWLLSTFLGAKARKRRAAARILSEPETEPTSAPEPEELRFGREDEEDEDLVQPVGIEPEEEFPEPATQPISPSGEYVDRVKAGPPRKPPVPTPPLEQLVRSLGIPKEFIPSGILPVAEEPLPEVEAEIAEPEGQPEEEMRQVSTIPPVPEASYGAEEAQVTLKTAGGITRLYKSVFPSLTPIQQAIVLKEVLDRPRALRRDIR
jgi:hypothetical protein